MLIRTTAPEHESRSKTRRISSPILPGLLLRVARHKTDATMSRDGGDRAPPMRKRVRAARLTLTHASGLRYALGDRRGRSLSRPSSRPSAFGHPRPVNGTALSTSPQTSSTRGGFPRFRDAPDHGLPPTRGVRWPVEIPRTHRRVASRSARFPRRPRARTERSIRNTASSLQWRL